MVLRRLLIGSLALVAAATTACSSDSGSGNANNGSLPEGGAVLGEASQASRDIRSAHFTLKANGDIAAFPVHSADGDLTREGGPSGGAKGKINMDLFGQLFEGEFVLVNDQVYIKGPTGSFQQLPAVAVANLYDPSAILNPDKGIAKVLSSVQSPKTEGTETVDGAATYKVSGRVAQDVVSSLVPGVTSEVGVTFWVRQDNKRPVKASVEIPGGNVDVTLSDLDKPVTVTPPA
ncbi:MAG: LppX_LprAFG lipoprotein [Labedaea sp.]